MQIPVYLVNENYGDRYFDVVNALDEAQQIYFAYNLLLERISASKTEGIPFVIGETGFGAGRVLVALLEYLHVNQVKDVDIIYNTVELHPISKERMRDILSSFYKRAAGEIDALVEAYQDMDTTVPGWHMAVLQHPIGRITLKLWIGEALEMVDALDTSCDVWFLDGHSPKKNPSIWRPELLHAIGGKTNINGACSTFTVASAVKKSLLEAGFQLHIHAGCGGKKESLQGIKTPKKRLLRHMVLFRYVQTAASDDITRITAAFGLLSTQISTILDFEWGENNSPEGINQGYTHCYMLSFSSEKDRDDYLVHPAHEIFKQTIDGFIESALVVDYWLNTLS